MTNKTAVLSDPQLLDDGQVAKAVHALYQYVSKSEDKNLIDGPEKINLQLTFKKASSIKKTIRIDLPTTLVSKTSEVCLFVKDLDRKERDYSATVRHYKDLLRNKGIQTVTEVIPLKSVKTEYKPFEAKRNLSNSFDVFLADDRIVGLLPALLGKHFYGRKRFPVAVKLTSKDLKKEMTSTLSCTQCILTGRGSNCQVTVAHTDLTEQQAVDNVLAAAQRLAALIPAGPNNVKVMHLRTENSPALTVYAALGASDDIKLPKKKVKLELDDPEEVTTVMHGKVRVTPQGYVHVINKASAPHINNKAKKKRSNIGQRKVPRKKTASHRGPDRKKSLKAIVKTDTKTTSVTRSRKRKLAVKTD